MPKVDLITTSGVADRFGVDSSAVRRWVSEGKITPAFTTPGGHYRFRLSDIEALLGVEASA
ncbi:MerR family transcriptional regulator [Mycolicibacterium fluoranthenivorans]|uniref:Excisionase family DNA binding protein n=1 Tax=Mycolicibacterium fluoranthenivorans TaxID=258505 RepID=A0A7X5ZFB7_9MYCO|nr:helix-turn-helix domain-containing protein [Mycolicibacterium fluoranthenivorans]MCV7358522.1 helix-turn-helix domain-containing protein [Mycolicibacterium fluoranthenivorans]NIH98099.1 excisionase family DNA binding protein [Mycolicibacterium fluoranthenivorans]